MTPTPEGFDSPFLRARAVRHGRHPAPVRPSKELTPGSMIPWREFVQAIFLLPAGWDYHGNLPEGVSSQQFWSRVNRAAKQATRVQRGVSMSKLNHARVGIIIRGDRFWVWPEKVPEEQEEKIPERKRGWIGKLLLMLRSGDPVDLLRKLTKKEERQLRVSASKRGWRLSITDARVVQGSGSVRMPMIVSRVQWTGEVVKP